MPRSGGEDDTISLNYTSGTTGKPKGVMYTFRGAYLNALAEIFHANLRPESVYLWTLPMFHCNGWCFPWAVTAAGATHVCLRKVDAAGINDGIHDEGVTHFCAAPTVLIALANHPDTVAFPHRVVVTTAGAPPAPATIAQIEALGAELHHVYGLTEVYGPITECAWHSPQWDGFPPAERARLRSRQGVPMITLGAARRARRRRRAQRRAVGRDDARRDRHARQQRDEGLLRRPRRNRTKHSKAAGSTPATSRWCTRTATSRSSTARKT